MIRDIKSKTKYYYTMRETCTIIGVKPHVLRFWETQFPQLHPKRRKNTNRRYTSKDIRTIKKIKYLLYEKGYTIQGAKKSLKSTELYQMEIQTNLKFDKEKLKLLIDIKSKLKNLKKITRQIKEN